MTRSLVSLLLTCVLTLPAWGWGETGHRTVGLFAAARLGGKARKQVARILGVVNTPEAVAAAMAEASYWADKTARTLYPQAATWHYINLSLRDGAADKPDPFLAGNSVFSKSNQYAAALRAGWPDELEPASDLKFLLHFSGDLHQPMHTGTNQDLGGNCVLVDEYRNLHSAWDTGLLERALGKDPAAIAKRLLENYRSRSDAERRGLEGRDAANPRDLIRQWVLESHELALTRAYDPLKPAMPRLAMRQVRGCADAAAHLNGRTWKLDEAYRQQAGQTIEEQLTRAGARLAALLDRVWR